MTNNLNHASKGLQCNFHSRILFFFSINAHGNHITCHVYVNYFHLLFHDTLSRNLHITYTLMLLSL